MITTTTTFIILAFVISCVSAFLLLLAAKWGLVEWMQVHGNDFFAKMANCDFCLSWWTNVVLCVAIFIVTGEHWYLLMPFVNTIITRKLI